MLYAITLLYRQPKQELERHADSHKQWLAEKIKTGFVIFAGPLNDGRGGFILATGTDDAAVKARLADDPFVQFGLADAAISAVTPAICSERLPAEWAEKAKVIASP